MRYMLCCIVRAKATNFKVFLELAWAHVDLDGPQHASLCSPVVDIPSPTSSVPILSFD